MAFGIQRFSRSLRVTVDVKILAPEKGACPSGFEVSDGA